MPTTRPKVRTQAQHHTERINMEHMHCCSYFFRVGTPGTNVATDLSPTGDLLVSFIFPREDHALSLLKQSRVLRWHSTSPLAARPLGKYMAWLRPDIRVRRRRRL